MAKKREWQIRPSDIRWVGYEESVIITDGWEPFGVSPVPNTLNPNQIRLWLRRQLVPKHRHPWEIRIQQAGWGGHQVGLHLTAHWEPFGVSISPPDQPIIWFRRKVEDA